MNSRIIPSILAFSALISLASAGCMVSMVPGTAAISVGISWQSSFGNNFGSDENGYVVPLLSTMQLDIKGVYTVHCEDGDNHSAIPPHRIVLTDLATGSNSTTILPANGNSGHWCPARRNCPTWACDGGAVYDGIEQAFVEFNKAGKYAVKVQYLAYAVDPNKPGIPDSNWITDKNFNLAVFSPIIQVYGSRTTILQLQPGTTTTANIVWTLQNLTGIDLNIKSISSPKCADNNLACSWIASPEGLKVEAGKSIILTQQVSLENPPADYAPRDIDFFIDVNYSDSQESMSFEKLSGITVLKIKPVSEKKFSIKVKGPEANACYGIENGSLKTGYSGKAALPKIRLEWNWSGISMTECDKNSGNIADYHYCDAVQFSIELLKRLERIDNIKSGNTAGEPSERLVDELLSLQNFEAYLQKDGFSKDLTQDLSLYLQAKALLQIPGWFKESDGNFQAFFTNPSHFKILLAQNKDSLASAVQLNAESASTTALGNPGLFEILIKIKEPYNDNSLKKFVLNQGINTDINVYLVEKTMPALDSVFYRLPIDGEIGFVENSNGGAYDRQGYGSFYTPANQESSNLLVFPAGQPPAAAGTGFAEIKTEDIPDNFAILNQGERGSVLKVSGNSSSNGIDVKRYLSTATPVLMKITQGKLVANALQASSEAGSFYYIKKNETNENPGALVSAASSGPMSYWTGIASNMVSAPNSICMDFEAKRLSTSFYSKPDSRLSSLSASAQSNCILQPDSLAENSFGFSWSLPQESSQNFLFAQTVFYTTAGANYKLKPACANKDNWLFTLPLQGIYRTGAIQLDYVPEYIDGSKIDVEALSSIFKAVENGFICLKNEAGKSDFWWNEKKLFENLDNRQGLDQSGFPPAFNVCTGTSSS